MLYDHIKITHCVLTGARKILIFGHVALHKQRLDKICKENFFPQLICKILQTYSWKLIFALHCLPRIQRLLIGPEYLLGYSISS